MSMPSAYSGISCNIRFKNSQGLSMLEGFGMKMHTGTGQSRYESLHKGIFQV